MNHGSTLFGCSFRMHGMDGAPFDGIKLGKVGLGQMDCFTVLLSATLKIAISIRRHKRSKNRKSNKVACL